GGQQMEPDRRALVEPNLPALFGIDDDMVVALERMLGGARRVVQGHAARHAEMGDQGVAIVEPQQQVFCPAVDAQDPPSFDTFGELLRQGHPQIAPALDQADDASPYKLGRETAAHGFDFGQLGHLASQPPRAPNRAVPTRTWVAPSLMAVS